MKGESKVFGLRILLITLLLITSISYAVSRGSVEFNETLFIVKDSIWYSSIELDSDNVISFYALVCTDVERQTSEIAAIRIATNNTASYETIYRKNTITLSCKSFGKFAEALERALELELNPGESLYFDSNGLLSFEVDSWLEGELIFGGGRYYHLHYDSSYSGIGPNNTAYELIRGDIEKICQTASELAKEIELFNSAKKPIEIVPETVLVERGSFTMGDDSLENASPSHQAFITYDFYIGKYETTFDEYDWFVRETGRSLLTEDFGWGRETRPVIVVSWWDAVDYCNWLSQKEGLPQAYDSEGNLLDKYGNVTADITNVVGYRLPTEAEWEYAARGGKKSEGYMYAGSNNLGDVAWYWRNSGDEYLTGEYFLDSVFDNNSKTHPVGAKQSNELGIYDMSGNVMEWCSDWYDSGYYAKIPTTKLYNYTPSYNRVVRGGDWSSNVMDTRVVDRGGVAPDDVGSNVGFRIARTVP